MTFRCFRAAVAVSWVLFFNAATAPSARPRYEVMPAEGSQGGVSAIHGITPQQLDVVLAETLSAELLCCENLTASEFLRISRLFGGKEVVSRHVVHPSSPSEDILRLSNQAEHGVVQVGPQWHQDGSTEKAVFSHLLLHALRPGAPTHFADLAKAYEVLEPETQEQWLRMASAS
ncbi:unnamed protein product [Cladocopium goreaui]|uniref:Taurine dioxygenase n=1 Tax=Cladocopium goreaui TaxID=2562237 RepID=A0A9P1CFR3_9DINO|nr:unnamed protein product [Cladocopium goreaui]